MNPISLSAAGAAFIAAHEGFIPDVYQDDAGNDTIGFGHLLPPKGAPLPAGMAPPLSRDQGLQLLSLDAQYAADAVTAQVTAPLNQNQFDALTSFAFGAGSGGLAKSGLVELINAGHIAAALQAWPSTYVHNSAGQVNPGLVLVRPNEARLFATPAGHTYVYDGRIAPEAAVPASMMPASGAVRAASVVGVVLALGAATEWISPGLLGPAGKFLRAAGLQLVRFWRGA